MDEEMILCDSDVIVELWRNNPGVVELIKQLGEENLYINAIIKAEIQNKAVDKRDLRHINQRLENFPLIMLDDDISEKFNDLFEKYLLSHRPAVPDMLVAATALSYDISLFTLNIDHFSFVSGLKLIQHELKPLARKKGSWFL